MSVWVVYGDGRLASGRQVTSAAYQCQILSLAFLGTNISLHLWHFTGEYPTVLRLCSRTMCDIVFGAVFKHCVTSVCQPHAHARAREIASRKPEP